MSFPHTCMCMSFFLLVGLDTVYQTKYILCLLIGLSNVCKAQPIVITMPILYTQKVTFQCYVGVLQENSHLKENKPTQFIVALIKLHYYSSKELPCFIYIYEGNLICFC